MTETPAPECTPACTEQHTYLLGTCALSCTEIKGSVAHPAWVVACPKCKARPDQPCLRGDGTPSGIVHEVRCEALDACRQPPTPAPAEARTADGEGGPAYVVDNLPRMAEKICPGFPDKCPNLKTVEPDPPAHFGGIRCGCADQTPTESDGGTPWCCNGNAEECALCTDPNPPYPFLCPGHPLTPENEARVNTPAPDGLRAQYAAALEAADYRPDMQRGDLADAVMSVRDQEMEQLRADLAAETALRRERTELYNQWRTRANEQATELQQLQTLLTEAVDWIHEGELRERICDALNPPPAPRAR